MEGNLEVEPEKSVPAGVNPETTEDHKDKDNNQEDSEKKKSTKNIFICYSTDAPFLEKKFVVETVKQFKENGLADDIWFDKDEKIINNCCWFAQAIEVAERCKAAVLILSESFLSCPVTIYCLKTLMDRISKVNIYCILYELIDLDKLPIFYHNILEKTVDLTDVCITNYAEKSSSAVGALTVELEKFSIEFSPFYMEPSLENYFTGSFKKKFLCDWNVNDMQEWLQELGIREFYRQMFAESLIDGFLVTSLTEKDLSDHLNIDSRLARKKIIAQIVTLLDKEHKLPVNWHLRCRTTKGKPNQVYVIYDPTDKKLMQNLEKAFTKKPFKIFYHSKLGHSKEEFLKANSSAIATSSVVLVCLSDNAAKSPFVFQEVMFADWIGKKIMVLNYKNSWVKLRSSFKAVLSDSPAIDFEHRHLKDAVDILEYVLNPSSIQPGVVLEQSYINKMSEAVQPLGLLAQNLDNLGAVEQSKPADPAIFISFQWDTADKAEELRLFLEKNGYMCWTDVLSSRGGSGKCPDPSLNTLQVYLQRTMNAAKLVLCCITPKYIQSDNCVKDLSLADMLRKDIVPVMMSFTPWPPDAAPTQVRKILSRLQYIDLSNDKLVKQNLQILLERVHRTVGSSIASQ